MEEIQLSDWMGNLPPEVSSLPLCHIRIPGSHDSGADATLDPNLPIANDESKGIALAGLSIRDQLLSGIRYLDLRVSHPPETLRQVIGEFHLVHALYGPTLAEALQEVRSFLDKHPSEVVLLDVNHIFGIGVLPHMRLKEMIANIIGWKCLCPSMDPMECTLEWLHMKGYQTIVFLCGDAGGPFWSQRAIISHWPETNRVKQLVEFLNDRLKDDRPHHMHRFYVHQGVLTPTAKNVVTRWRSTLERALASSATSAVSTWLTSLSPSKRSLLNVVMVDFVSPEFNSSVIALNFSSKRVD